MNRQKAIDEGGEAALQRFLDLIARPGSCQDYPWGKRLVFTDSGAARLAHYAGMLYGMTAFPVQESPMEALADCGRDGPTLQERALNLAWELDRQLMYLGSYGGDSEHKVDGGRQTLTVPGFKIMLADDGCYGFSLMWYRPYTGDQIRDKAREIAEDDFFRSCKDADGRSLSDEDQTGRWSAALDKAKAQLRTVKLLEENRYYIPQWVRDEEAKHLAKHHEHAEDDFFRSCKVCDVSPYSLSGNYEFFHYGFSHNGGLILHGLERDASPSWSIHT